MAEALDDIRGEPVAYQLAVPGGADQARVTQGAQGAGDLGLGGAEAGGEFRGG